MLQVSTSSPQLRSVDKTLRGTAMCLCCSIRNKVDHHQHPRFLLARGNASLGKLRTKFVSSPRDMAEANSVLYWG